MSRSNGPAGATGPGGDGPTSPYGPRNGPPPAGSPNGLSGRTPGSGVGPGTAKYVLLPGGKAGAGPGPAGSSRPNARWWEKDTSAARRLESSAGAVRESSAQPRPGGRGGIQTSRERQTSDSKRSKRANDRLRMIMLRHPASLARPSRCTCTGWKPVLRAERVARPSWPCVSHGLEARATSQRESYRRRPRIGRRVSSRFVAFRSAKGGTYLIGRSQGRSVASSAIGWEADFVVAARRRVRETHHPPYELALSSGTCLGTLRRPVAAGQELHTGE